MLFYQQKNYILSEIVQDENKIITYK